MALLLQAPALAAALLFAVVVYAVISRFLAWRRLCHVPGPTSAGWSRSWLVKHQLAGKLPKDVADLCEKYGRYCT